MIFRVWNPDASDENAARAIRGRPSPADAAHWFATVFDRDDWDDSPRTYHVRDESGVLWAVEVRCAMEPVFMAGEPRRMP